MRGGNMVWVESTYKQNSEGRLDLNKFELSQNDTEMTRVKKIRKATKCYMCKKTIPKGSWCYGERYMKICIECERDKYFPKIISDINKLESSLVDEQEKLDINWEKYQRENTLANLQHND